MANNPFGNGPKGGTATKTAPPAASQDQDDAADASGPVGIGPKRDPFAMPSGGGSDYKISEFLGELLLVSPTEVDSMVTSVSKDGPSEFVRVDVIRLDNGNERVDDLLVFQEALRRTLKKVLRGDNAWVLGRLEMGTAQKGKNAPYILSKPTEEDVARGQAAYKELGLKG